MDIDEEIQKMIELKEDNLQSSLTATDRRISELKKRMSSLISRKDIPDETDTLSKLIKANGKMVIIQPTYKSAPYPPQILELEGLSVCYPNASRDPLISNSAMIEKITDCESGEVIFENLYKNADIYFQTAMIFGRKFAMKDIEANIEFEEGYKKAILESYKRQIEDIKKIPDWIIEGCKFIYPQRKQTWEDRVLTYTTYEPLTLEYALKIMEKLDHKNFEEAKKIYEKTSHTENDVLDLVVKFSKQGPEFYRAAYPDKNPEWLQEVERENQQFERELSDGGKH